MKYVFPLVLTVVLAGHAQVSLPWNLKTIAGGTEAGDGGMAAEASIRYLQGVATDAAGNVYFSDADDHRVRRVDRSGVVTTLAGDGVAGFSGDGGLAVRARVNSPYGLTVTPVGDLVFADLGNARVRRILRNGQIETLIGGGVKGLPAQGQFMMPREVKLIAPRNVLATAGGSIFVSEFGANRLLELRSDGILRTVLTGELDLNSPAGLALDSGGNVLVADSGNARVRRIRLDGSVETVVASSREMPLERPVGIAMRADKSLLIADTRGDFLWQVDALGSATIIPPGGRDVTVDLLGNIVTAGGTWLRRVNRLGLIEVLIGNAFTTYRGDEGPALGARLNRPVGVVADSKGNVFFSDTGNHRVRMIGLDGVIRTVAGVGEAGFRGDGVPARQAYLNGPTYLAVDRFDNVYVSDTGNQRVRVFVPGGVIQTFAGTGRNEFSNDNLVAAEASLSLPAGLAFDTAGNLYIAERGQNRVRRCVLGGRIATVAGSGVRGVAFDGQDALLASLNGPGAIAVDVQGNLYIADQGNNAVRKVEAGSGKMRTLATGVQRPEGLAVALGGAVYVVEARRHRVLQLGLDGSLTVVAGRTDEDGFNVDAGNAGAVTLNEPAGLAILPDGGLVVADRLNDRIRRLDAPQVILAGNSVSTSVVHAATFLQGAIAPGQMLSILTGELAQPELAEVTLDGMAAVVSYAGKSQVNFQAPYGIAGRTRVSLDLRVGGALVFRTNLNVAGAVPGFFEAGGVVVAVSPEGLLNREENPARAGDVLTLYGTGEGLLRELKGLMVPFLPLSVEINGVPADIQYAGAAPGYSGLLQVNLRVPANIRLKGRVPVTLRVGAFTNHGMQMLVVQ